MPLANFFGISIDELFDRNSRIEDEKVDEYLKEDRKLVNKGYTSEHVISKNYTESEEQIFRNKFPNDIYNFVREKFCQETP